MTKRFFVTGTDTEVGKTVASCALLQAANREGFNSAGYKPVASGSDYTAQGLRNEDALALQRNSRVALRYEILKAISTVESEELDGMKYLVVGDGPLARTAQFIFDNDVLLVRGEKRQEQESKDGGFHRVERSYGSFQRALNLPTDANQDTIKAAFKNGVLTITMEKREASPLKEHEQGQKTMPGLRPARHGAGGSQSQWSPQHHAVV